MPDDDDAGELEIIDSMEQVTPKSHEKRPYPAPYAGNVRPVSKPDYSMFVLYNILKGRSINVSFKRMVNMMADLGKVENVANRFMESYTKRPRDSQYRMLAQALAKEYGLNYTYTPTDRGDMVRVWKKTGPKARQEYVFEIMRGEHKIRKSQQRDYSKLLGVKPSDMLTFEKALKRSEVIRRVRGRKK